MKKWYVCCLIVVVAVALFGITSVPVWGASPDKEKTLNVYLAMITRI
jgi:hypothetical protein